MGNLAAFLQQEFSRRCPSGWHAEHEVGILSSDLRRLLGYSPRVDVLLERKGGSQRVWVEFEISRADPVANHAKLATAHLFRPQGRGEVFLSMVSPHVTSGRRNLAANMIYVMRHLGMSAYQTVLLPTRSGSDVKRLNYLPLEALRAEAIDVDSEVARALSVTLPVLETVEGNIHFATNVMEALLNVYRWNLDLMTDDGREMWGKRTVTYFVYNPRFRQFAPSKYCAYVPISQSVWEPGAATMTVDTYALVERKNRIFDGTRAREHLTRGLAMNLMDEGEQSRLEKQFEKWMARHQEVIGVHPSGPRFIVPPRWF